MNKICTKLLSVLLVAAMLCSILPGLASATASAEPKITADPKELIPGGAETLCDVNGITEYATKDTRAETYTYVLVKSEEHLTPGEYILVASATGPYAGDYGFYALTTTEDSRSYIIQGVGQTFTDIPPALNVSSSVCDQFSWTLQGNLSDLTLKSSAGTYLTAASGSSSLTMSSQGTHWSGAYHAPQKAFTLKAYDRYLALRTDVTVVGTNGMCGFATSVPGTADPYIHMYKRVNTTELQSLVVYHSLDLSCDITMNYVIPKAQLAGFEQIRMEVNQPIYEGNSQVDLKTYLMEPTEINDNYYFTIDGMTAVQMNDVLQAVIYAYKDGVEYITETDNYSIATYAYNQMAKADTTPELRTLCAELLRYGTMSQLFKDYRTDALADASMTEEQKAYLTPLEKVVFGSCNRVLNDLPGAAVTWAGKALNLQSKIALRMVLDLSQYTGSVDELSVRVSYIDIDGKEVTHTVNDCEVYREEGSLYAFDFSGLRAAELRTVLSAAAYLGDTQVSATLQYSVDSYGNGKTGDLLTTCQALIAYSDAARNYFG